MTDKEAEIIQKALERFEKTASQVDEIYFVLMGDLHQTGLIHEHRLLMDVKKAVETRSHRFWNAVQISFIGLFMAALFGAVVWILTKAFAPLANLFKG